MKEQEVNPSSSMKTAWSLGGGPVGSAAGKGVSTAAKASLAVCQEAIKVVANMFTNLLQCCRSKVACAIASNIYLHGA